MTAPALPAFTISTATHLYDIIGATVAGGLTGEALDETRVVFTSNIPPGSMISYQGNLFRAPAEVYATVSPAGAILQDDGLPVALLANDSGLNVTGIQWTVTVRIPTPGSTSPLNPWSFNAPAAGTVLDLSTTAPVPSLSAVGVAQGPKGDPVDDVKLIGGNLIFYVDEQPVGTPIALSAVSAILDWANITNKPATFPPAAASVGPAQLSATGTPSASDFLRGDNSWAQPTAGEVTYSNSGTPTDVQSYLSSFTSSVNAALATMQLLSQKGIANGYAGLDASGHVPLSQLSGVLSYMGLWDATANSPTLANGSGTSGEVFIVGTTGTRNLGAGTDTYKVGDMLIYNGTVWDHVGSISSTITTVAGLSGSVITAASLVAALGLQIGSQVQAYSAALQAIAGLSPNANDFLQYVSGAWANRTPAQAKATLALTSADVGLGNCNNTADSAKNVATAAALASAITLLVNLGSTTGASFTGAANASIGVSGTLPVANGGTGAATLTGVLIGSGTSAITAVAAPLGTIVGTSDIQALTGKTIDGRSNTLQYIPVSAMNATGTPGSSNYLRGDGTWSTPPGATGSTTPTATTSAEWDANLNLSANNVIDGFATTATAAGTTTLTVASAAIQQFTGTSTQIVKLATTSVPAGFQQTIVNNSTGNVTVQASGGGAIAVLTSGTSAIFTALTATPTTAAGWNAFYLNGGSLSGTYSAMPTAGQPGRQYICTDTGDEYLDTGSAWILTLIGRGPVLAAPPTSGWSTTNLAAGSAVTASAGGYLLTGVGTAGDSLQAHLRSLSPASNYTAVFYIDWTLYTAASNYPTGGILLSDGTKYLLFGPISNGGSANMILESWASSTSKNSGSLWSDTGSTGSVYSQVPWWAIKDDGTNLNFMWSRNGIDWVTSYSMGRTSFLTPSAIGWGVDNHGSSTCYGRLRSLTGVS